MALVIPIVLVHDSMLSVCVLTFGMPCAIA